MILLRLGTQHSLFSCFCFSWPEMSVSCLCFSLVLHSSFSFFFFFFTPSAAGDPKQEIATARENLAAAEEETATQSRETAKLRKEAIKTEKALKKQANRVEEMRPDHIQIEEQIALLERNLRSEELKRNKLQKDFQKHQAMIRSLSGRLAELRSAAETQPGEELQELELAANEMKEYQTLRQRADEESSAHLQELERLRKQEVTAQVLSPQSLTPRPGWEAFLFLFFPFSPCSSFFLFPFFSLFPFFIHLSG